MDKLYPIGSLYITTNITNPLESLITGSKWETIKEGNTIFTGSDDKLGTCIEAGLPNIEGNLYLQSVSPVTFGDGAFEKTSVTDGETYGGSGSYTRVNMNFDASRANSIYGKSDTVQPPSIYVKIFKRIG